MPVLGTVPPLRQRGGALTAVSVVSQLAVRQLSQSRIGKLEVVPNLAKMYKKLRVWFHPWGLTLSFTLQLRGAHRTPPPCTNMECPRTPYKSRHRKRPSAPATFSLRQAPRSVWGDGERSIPTPTLLAARPAALPAARPPSSTRSEVTRGRGGHWIDKVKVVR